jgi:hypothetical protein
MYLLERLPTAPLVPSPFLTGSSDYLNKVLGAIKSQYSVNNPRIVNEWKDWAATAPQSDNAQDFIVDHPEQWHIPFQDVLFPDQQMATADVPSIASNKREQKPKYRQMETTDCVQWKMNGGKSHKILPRRPLGGEDVVSESAPTKSRKKSTSTKPRKKSSTAKSASTKSAPTKSAPSKSALQPTVTVKRKKRPTGRSAQVVQVDGESGSDYIESDESSPVTKKIRVQSSRRAASASSHRLKQQGDSNVSNTDASDSDDVDSDGNDDVTSKIASAVRLSRRVRGCRRIVESSSEDEDEAQPEAISAAPEKEVSSMISSDEEASSSEDDVEVGDSEGEVSDAELDESVYEVVDVMGFQPVKPGPKVRVSNKWRDATYVRIYGCASHYLNWQFRNVVSCVDYRIMYVVRNILDENDSDALYFKCSRIGSLSSTDSQYVYVKCIDLMTTQKKNRVYEWMKSSSSNRSKKYVRKRVKQCWPGWAIVNEEGKEI